MKHSFVHKYSLLTALISSFAITACSDAITTTGGSAGDSAADQTVQAAIELIQPFVGIYDLQDNWMGQSGDQAFLSIRLTGSDGISEAALIDFDDTDNCIPQRPIVGEVIKDPITDRVFLNDIPDFPSAVLRLSGSTLSIETIDVNDLDSDGSRNEEITIQAQRLGVMENDLGVACS